MRSLADAIASVKADGRHQQVRCPAHDDRQASLSVDAGTKGGIVLKCHAGCDTRDVLAAEGLTLADLAPARPTLTEDAVYDYRDEHGALLYQVVRYTPKTFKQRKPDGAGGYVWSLVNVRRVLYRLPELKGHARVWFVEGEKDADRLASLGLPVTTFAGGGSAKWSPDFTAQLVAAGVTELCVIPDNDATGLKMPETIRRGTHGSPLTVRTIPLPGAGPKGDVSDWLNAGHTKDQLLALLEEENCPVCGISNCENQSHAVPPRFTGTHPVPGGNGKHPPARMVRLTAANTITPQPVHWLWDERVARGTFALVGGREGIGKSLCVLTLAADLTRGELAGCHAGTPKAVLIAATEDSWEHTIVPRLMAANADLARVYRVDVATTKLLQGELSIPDDLADLEKAIPEVDAGLLILDPLLSRLAGKLDSHKDAEVRQALEPIVTLADRTQCTVIGLIHVNKSGSQDALTSLMGSRAFAAVARSVLFVMKDPEHEETRLLGQAKNNLGRTGLPTRTFTVTGHNVAPQGQPPIWTGKLEWAADTDRSIREILSEATTVDSEGHASAVSDAADWLTDYLEHAGGTEDSNKIRRAAAQAGHTKNTIYRAKDRLGLLSASSGYPRKVYWSVPTHSVPARAGAQE